MKKITFFSIFLFLISSISAKGSSASIRIEVKEKNSHFWSEEEIERNIVLINDSENEKRVILFWQGGVLSGPSPRLLAVVEREEKELTLSPGEKKMIPVLLKLPPVKIRMDYLWQIKASGDELATKSLLYQIFPRPRFSALASYLGKKGVGLYDPTGTATNILKEIGVPFTLINNFWGWKLFSGEFIIIGPNAFQERSNPLFRLFTGKVAGGAKVICLAQNSFPKEIPIPFSLVKRNIKKVNFISSDTQLKDEDFINWSNDDLVSQFQITNLSKGNFLILATSEEESAIFLLIPYGKGWFLFNQSLVAEKFFEEPIAQIIFKETLEKMVELKPCSWRKASYLNSLNDELFSFLRGIGFNDSPSSDLIIASVEKEKEIENWIFKKNGQVLVFNFGGTKKKFENIPSEEILEIELKRGDFLKLKEDFRKKVISIYLPASLSEVKSDEIWIRTVVQLLTRLNIPLNKVEQARPLQ